MKKKKNPLFLVVALLAALLFFTSSLFWWSWATRPVDPKAEKEKVFVIRRGESISSVAKRLGEERLIRSPFAFKILVSLKGLSKKIQAGDFRLRSSLAPEEIARLLTHGSLDVWLTFPEGWRREEFGQRLAANLKNFDYQEFLNLTKDLEGYLFPDTYLIPKEATPGAVVRVFTNNFEKKFTPALEKEAKDKGLSKKQVLILASIVEREVRYSKDRPIVAGILIKRWREGWPLQADATVQYAVATYSSQLPGSRLIDWWPPVKKSDLEVDSPYNTYKYKGLPPTPICNPGLASIRAVMYFQETPYWYYLSDSQGKMHYSQTLEEHSKNIAKYLH